jgi:starch phosphorylase
MTRKFCLDHNFSIDKFISYGREKDTDSLFSMTILALKLSGLTNAVSKIHGEKARELWPLYKIIHITNGIYIPRWDKISKEDLIAEHEKNEERLLSLIREVQGQDWKKEALLLGWSRRFVPYKRPLALLEDIHKLKRLAEYFKGKIHIVYSAPLDKDDAEHNEFLKKIYEFMNGELRELITFLPNYDLDRASILVAGCDVWLNTPIVGREACGTSGMKAALNGSLTLSTNDGWIAEVPADHFGWIAQDDNITESLLTHLEYRIIPEYLRFVENPNGSDWKRYMENSRQLILDKFSAKRMLDEYIEKLYKPVLNSQ